jgi:ribose 5-phosphate isomerase A
MVERPPTRTALKRAAAERAVAWVEDGMVLGLGSGTTAEVALALLARRVTDGLRVVGVPTSRRIERLARRHGVSLATLDEHRRLDLTIDGAEEVEPRRLALIKGRGGALLREKIVAAASETVVIIVDESKLVRALGERQPVPVEVVPFGWSRTAAALEKLGGEVSLRRRSPSGRPYVTDGGNHIVDCRFGRIGDPAALERSIKALPGVVESGIFVGLADRVVVAGAGGVRVIERRAGARRNRLPRVQAAQQGVHPT